MILKVQFYKESNSDTLYVVYIFIFVRCGIYLLTRLTLDVEARFMIIKESVFQCYSLLNGSFCMVFDSFTTNVKSSWEILIPDSKTIKLTPQYQSSTHTFPSLWLLQISPHKGDSNGGGLSNITKGEKKEEDVKKDYAKLSIAMKRLILVR